MFDQENYESDEGENTMYSSKHMGQSKVSVVPSSGMDFNHLTGEGQSLLKMMKQRGFDLSDNEVKKIKDRKEFKSKDKQTNKNKQKAGFYDGGNSASMQELLKGLNKAFSKADPQQASCILSYILEKKNLTPQEKNKFGIMKCNLLFGLGAYEQSLNKSQQFLEKPLNKLSGAIFSNLIAKSKAQIHQTFQGYFDFLRAKSLINEYKHELESLKVQIEQKNTKQSSQSTQQQEEFKDSQLDTVIRQINHTQLQYNIKLSQIRNSSNLVHPHFPQFRQRNVKQVVCGDFHALFLIGSPLSSKIQTQLEPNWQNEVFGVGENTVGQITGSSTQHMFKEPILISYLSGKGIEGIWATRQSSLAYDTKGNIYEWGVKQNRNQKIDITFSVGQRIKHLEKGYKHYAALTQSKTFYTWGVIRYKQVTDVYNKPKPHMINLKNISGFSCGKGNVIAWDQNGQAYALGDNEQGQLGLEGELYTKQYKQINKDKIIGDIRKVYCLGDLTFFLNTYEEVFYSGKYSYNKSSQQKIKQAEFYEELPHIIGISGSIGNYYVTDSLGNLHRWDVDSSVKFKINNDEKVSQRYVANSRGVVYRVKSLIEPNLCSVKRITENPKTFEMIEYRVELRDKYGPYGNDFFNPLRCQIFLSTYKANPNDIIKENKLYLENFETPKEEKDIILSQIVQSRLMDCIIKRSQEPYYCNLLIQADRAGRFYFYVMIQSQLIFSEELLIEVSQRERQLEQQAKLDRQMREEQRRKKAQMQKQRLIDQKLRKEEQEQERRRQTQRRAQETLKKHMKEQEEERIRAEQERKRKQQLQTGGGFDLSKLRKSSMEKSGESFLPSINMRPSSKRKVNLPKPSQLIGIPGTKMETSKQTSNIISTSSSYNSGFQSEKRQKSKPSIGQNVANLTNTGITTTTSRPLVKRGLSKGKKT